MKRRVSILATILAILVVTAACGSSTTATASAAPATAAPAASAAASAAPSAAADPTVLPKPELTKVRFGISAPTEPVQFAAKLADYLGYYQKYGITTVEVTGFEGDAKALQALVAGQLDFFVGGSSAAVSAATTENPLNILSMNSVLNTDGLYCQKEIKTKEDVKGKTIAISTFGGTSHGSAILALRGLGYTSKDAVIKEVGNEGTRIAALKSGSIACAVVGTQQDATLKGFGMNILIDTAKDGKVQWGRSGLMTTTAFIAKNPNTVLAVVAAGVQAQNQFWVDNAGVAVKFGEWAQLKPADAQNVVKQFLDYGLRSMIFSEDALTAPKEVLASVNPALANVDLKKTYNLTFLNKLKDSGWYAKLGIPTN